LGFLAKISLTKQALVFCATDSLRTGMHLQFSINIFDVGRDCLRADIDFQSNRAAGTAVCNQF
jgi:hypothetical protein